MTKAQEMIEKIVGCYPEHQQEQTRTWLTEVYEAGREAAYEEMYVEFSPVAEGISRLHERLTP